MSAALIQIIIESEVNDIYGKQTLFWIDCVSLLQTQECSFLERQWPIRVSCMSSEVQNLQTEIDGGAAL